MNTLINFCVNVLCLTLLVALVVAMVTNPLLIIGLALGGIALALTIKLLSYIIGVLGDIKTEAVKKQKISRRKKPEDTLAYKLGKACRPVKGKTPTARGY